MCRPSSNPELIDYYTQIKESLVSKSIEREINFTTIGISNETSVAEGLLHLERFDSFNEIAIGNGMSNIGIQRYVWDEFSYLAAATPQIVILFRRYEMVERDGELFVHPEILKDSILTRAVGISQFEKLSQDVSFYKSF